jgi:hypothetical protein
MQIDGTDNIPFSLFISAQRRRKILNAMWSSDDQSKKDGEKILGNYKKQLAEKAAREHIDSSYAESRPPSATISKMSRCTIKTKKTGPSRSRKNSLNSRQSSRGRSKYNSTIQSVTSKQSK